MMKKKPSAAFLLALTCLLLVTACGAPAAPAATTAAAPAAGTTTAATTAAPAADATTAAPVTTAAAAGTTAAEAAPATDVTLSYWVTTLTGPSRQKISSFAENLSYIEKERLTGVKIEWIHPPEGQENENFALMIASNDLPDLIETADKYKGGVERGIIDGMYLDIGPMADEFAPNYMAALNSNDDVRREMYTDNGYLLGFGMFCSNDPDDVQIITRDNPWAGMQIRGDWLEELGLEVPQTIDDWTEALSAFKEAKNPEIVMAIEKTARDGNGGAFTSAYGIAPDFYLKDGKVLWGANQPEWQDYVTQMYEWYAAGLIDQDFPTRAAQDVEAAYLRNQLGAKMFDGTAFPLKGEAVDIKMVGAPWPKLDDASEDIQWAYLTNMNRGFLTCVTTACEVPEEALKWMDWNYTEEGSNILNFGPQGQTYDVRDADGRPQYFEQWAGANWDANSSVFRVHNAAYLQHDFHSNPRRGMAHLEAYRVMWEQQQINNNAYHLPPITLTAEEGAEDATIMADANTYRDEMLIRFITGAEPLENFSAYYENMAKFDVARSCELREIALARYNAR